MASITKNNIITNGGFGDETYNTFGKDPEYIKNRTTTKKK